MVAIAAWAPNEGLPVVVERLDAPGGRAMHGEGDDLVPAFVKRVVESSQGPDGVGARSPKNVSEPLLHRGAIGRGEDLAKLLLDLVGASQCSILRDRGSQRRSMG